MKQSSRDLRMLVLTEYACSRIRIACNKRDAGG
jgi:hypothetical protein